MLLFAPLLSRPLLALPDNSLPATDVVCDTIVEARLDNPLAELVQDARKQLVLAVQVTAVPLDV